MFDYNGKHPDPIEETNLKKLQIQKVLLIMKVLLVGHFENIWSTNEMLKSFSRLGDKVQYLTIEKLPIKTSKVTKKIYLLIINKILSFLEEFLY